MEKSARFSPCRRYRYELWRRWAEGPYAQFICLNPSIADEVIDDPTVRRVIRFAKDWGYSAVCMTNIFAFRATDPRDMKAEEEPIGGEENDSAIRSVACSAGIVIAAWGVHGAHLDRGVDVMNLIPRLHCLGVTNDGHPKHPLYLRADSKPAAFSLQ